MPITPLPALDRTSVNFKASVDAFFGSQLPTFSIEAEAARADIVIKQGQAAASATNAATSEGNALSSKNAAATSKTDADTARNAAQSAQVAAEAALDSFDDRYLGAKSAAPALDNDGAALLIGSLYWDTAAGLRGWNGSAWITLPAATASAVANIPAGNIAATTVQGALNEIDAKKQVIATLFDGDLNTLKTSGMYFGNQWTNGPVPAFDATFTVIAKTPTNSITQELQRIHVGNYEMIWRRHFYNSSTWTPWRLIYNQSNILGAVFQQGGIPTGAIIERGSNVIGEYVRLADGTQISRSTVITNATTNAGVGLLPPLPVAAAFSGDFITLSDLAFFPQANAMGQPLYAIKSGYTEDLYLNTGQSSATVSPSFTMGQTVSLSYRYKVVLIGRWF